MKMMGYGEAIREAMSAKMRENNNIVFFGEDVGILGGDYGVSVGMFAEFGEERVRDTPISESGIVGCAVGAAATGLRPIAELMMNDFLTIAMDQLANQAAKMRYMYGGTLALPMVLRLPAGAGGSAAGQHSQSLEAWVTHVPGLKVVYPSNAQDAYGLMLSAIDDDNPVMYFENKTMYPLKGEVTSFEPIPLGKGRIAREGKDLSIITWGRQVYDALEAADKLAEEGYSIEVIDLRSLYPLDKEMIAQTLDKTHRVIVLSEETKRGSYAGEICAMISEEMFDSLDAPVQRICALNTPCPFAPHLEEYYKPNARDLIVAAKKVL